MEYVNHFISEHTLESGLVLVAIMLVLDGWKLLQGPSRSRRMTQ